MIEKSYHKILVIQTSFIGDVILTTGLVEKLNSKFLDSKIDFLVRKGNESILDNNPKINKVIFWNKNQGKLKNLLKISSVVRNNKYDLIINLQRYFSSGYICWRSNAREIVGYSQNPLSAVFSTKISFSTTFGKHEIERQVALIGESQANKPKLYPSYEDFESIAPYQSGIYTCLAPTSVWFTKQLPHKKWLELMKSIPTTTSIYLIGGPDDFDECEQLKKSSFLSNVQNLCGKLSILQTAALIQKAKMTYANDSAVTHIASAMNAPITTFFCSTIPQFGFGPLSDNSKIVETTKKLDCKPCGIHGYKKCPKGHFKCATTISVDHLV